MTYANLFRPLKVGSLTLKNRFVMPAMGTGLSSPSADFIDDEKAYYQERAKGGIGLIISGVCRIDKEGSAVSNQIAAFDIAHAGGFRKIADGVHRYGGRMFIQLHHAGRQTNTMVTGVPPVAPSAIPVPGMETPRELTTDEVKALRDKFIFGAVIAKFGNMDGVEIHAAHGYMLNQFISPWSNKRTDEYGGNTENRVRIIKEIIQGIKAQCGPDFPISVRISADDFVGEEGMQIDEAVEVAKLLESYGADMINVSGGNYLNMQGIIAPSLYEQGWMVHLAAAIKKAVKVPVAAVSLIRDFEYAEQIVADGKCDLVCMGRPSIVDPYFVNKLKTGREKEIRRCIACMRCSDSLAARLDCAVNPVVGFEKEYTHYNKNGNGRSVVIIGGGPGGCEAAFVLATRGFKVTMLEKSDKLGGQVKLAAVPPHKYRMDWLLEYYTYNLNRLGVEIKLNTRATVADIKAMNPYAVLLATGSAPVIPPIPGVDGDNVAIVDALLTGEVKLAGKKVCLVGSGNTGLEAAEYLLEYDNQVTIAEMLPKVGMLATTSGMYSLGVVAAKGAEMLAGHMLKSINGNKVEFTNLENSETVIKEFDNVILSLGVRKVNDLEEDLAANFKKFYVVGDAYQTGNIGTATKSGFQIGFLLDNEGDEIL